MGAGSLDHAMQLSEAKQIGRRRRMDISGFVLPVSGSPVGDAW